MTIVQMEYFLAVANLRSFVTAAERCFITASALSAQIAVLEKELGVTLVDRYRKPLLLTEAGEVFLEQVRKTLVEFYKSKEKIDEIKGELSGDLRIGVITTISPYLMPLFIPRFIKKCPHIKLRIYDMHIADIVESLASDIIDIAIFSGGESDVKISEKILFEDTLYMYVSPENELYGREEILIEDIDVEKLLILSEGNCLRNHTLRLCKARRAVDPPFDFVNGSLENLMYTVDRTSGATVIPNMAIRSIPKEKRDRIIPFAQVDARRKITMAISPTYIRESVVRFVRRTVMEVAREEFGLSKLKKR